MTVKDEVLAIVLGQTSSHGVGGGGASHALAKGVEDLQLRRGDLSSTATCHAES